MTAENVFLAPSDSEGRSSCNTPLSTRKGLRICPMGGVDISELRVAGGLDTVEGCVVCVG